MKSQLLKKSISTYLLTMALPMVGLTAQTLLIEEDFGGLSSDRLDGDTASYFNPLLSSSGGSSTWVGMNEFNQDGSVDVKGAVGAYGSAYLTLGSYVNDAKGNEDAIFSLEATFSNTSAVAAGTWIGVGFYEGTPSVNNAFFTTSANNTSFATALLRAEGDSGSEYYAGPNTTSSYDAGAISGTVTYKIVLDYSSAGGYDGVTNFGTVYFYRNGSNIADFSSALPDLAVDAISLTKTNNTTLGDYESLTFVQIPEPSSVALTIAFGALCGTFILRRRR
ncbi:PEP-CTERM sorting domain-containing protein [Coraliomargarita parva]|uniref:PEP-CTERM sorting domain-containing protein n=1 Tax=Coraliomargarita parva TaxID=3014050 RepID=UPI0022B5D02A|nr:PEP-CTERM sorting domain-containing protein [Coraliomargarita parva]